MIANPIPQPKSEQAERRTVRAQLWVLLVLVGITSLVLMYGLSWRFFVSLTGLVGIAVLLNAAAWVGRKALGPRAPRNLHLLASAIAVAGVMGWAILDARPSRLARLYLADPLPASVRVERSGRLFNGVGEFAAFLKITLNANDLPALLARYPYATDTSRPATTQPTQNEPDWWRPGELSPATCYTHSTGNIWVELWVSQDARQAYFWYVKLN